MRTDITIWIAVIVLFALLSSCKLLSGIQWHQTTADISKDTISVDILQDSTHSDTIRYSRKHNYTETAPRTIHGTWYIVAMLTIALAVIIFFKNN